MLVKHLERSLASRPGGTVWGEEGGYRAAVAAILRPGPDLLFIERAEREGDPWSGHMAFPGGHEEEEDATLIEAAKRETFEEVGIDLNRGRLLGNLNPMTTPRALPRRLTITPFVFVIDFDPEVVLDDEVASVHWFALDRLMAGEGRGTMDFSWRKDNMVLPCIRLDETLIWGITLGFLDELLDRLREDC